MFPTSLEQELLAHAAALRGLARALVGEHDADDLVQDVAVQALTRAPRRPGPLGAWLAAIVRHLASKHRRAARRRSAREQAVARPEALAPHDEVIAAQDALRVLAQSVLQLPDPYRSAVLLRYFRDLTPAEIAARCGEKIATVKSRLHRGLALLRERLGRGSNGWRDALVLTFGLDRLAPSTASIGGVLLMGTGTKLVVGAAILLAAAALWFTRGAPVPWPNAAVPPPGLSLVEPAPREAAVPRRQEHRRVVTPPDVPAVARVRGRCVDGAGQALAGCQVTLAQVPGSAGRVVAWTRERGPFGWQAPTPVVTGPDGGFALTTAPTGPHGCQLVAAAAGRETARARWAELVAGDDIEVGDVRLARLVTLRLHVTDGREAPWSGQTISFWRQDAGEAAAIPEPSTTVRTDAAGGAVVVLGTGRFLVRHSVPHVDAVDVAVNESLDGTELAIVLRGRHDGDAAIRGTVADPDGAPVPEAFVLARDADGRTINRTRTCRDGSFVLPMPANMLPAILTYGAPGWDEACTSAPVACDATDLRLILQRGSAVVVRVCAADDGAPVEDYVLTLWQEPGAWPVCSSRRHPRGEAVLDPVPRGEWLATVVPGDASLCARYGIQVSVGDIAPRTVDVVLPQTARRELRVLRADGSPVAGARVEVLDPRLKRVWTGAPPRERRSGRVVETPAADGLDLKSIARPFAMWSVDGPSPDAAQFLLLMTTTTDAGGAATLRGPPDQDVAVRLPGGECVPQLVPAVSLANADPLVLRVATGARVRGHITPAAWVATPPRETYVRLRCTDPGAAWRPRVERVAADGSFVVAGLPAGGWALDLIGPAPGTDHGDESRLLATLSLREGETVERDFTVDDPMARVHGTVIVDGAPAADATLALATRETGPQRREATGPIAADGRFELRADPGEYRACLILRTPEPLFLHLDGTVVLEPGAVLERAFVLRTGRLRVLLVDDQGRPVPDTELRVLAADGAMRAQVRSDAVGRIDQRIAAGMFRLVIGASRAESASELPDLATVEVPPGNQDWQRVVMQARPPR